MRKRKNIKEKEKEQHTYFWNKNKKCVYTPHAHGEGARRNNDDKNFDGKDKKVCAVGVLLFFIFYFVASLSAHT